MKKFITLILIFLASIAWGQSDSRDINPAFNPKNFLIDVRTPSEFQYDHLKGAVNIPYNKIAEDIKYFVPDKEKTIVVYCQSGKRSDIALKRLKEMGYKNVINAGKFKDLKKLEEEQE